MKGDVRNARKGLRGLSTGGLSTAKGMRSQQFIYGPYPRDRGEKERRFI